MTVARTGSMTFLLSVECTIQGPLGRSTKLVASSTITHQSIYCKWLLKIELHAKKFSFSETDSGVRLEHTPECCADPFRRSFIEASVFNRLFCGFLFGAGGGNRTHMRCKPPRILSPVCLPISSPRLLAGIGHR